MKTTADMLFGIVSFRLEPLSNASTAVILAHSPQRIYLELDTGFVE